MYRSITCATFYNDAFFIVTDDICNANIADAFASIHQQVSLTLKL